MAGARSQRLAGPTLIGESVDTTVITCPAGQVCLIKWMTVNNASSSLTVEAVIGINGTLGANRIWRGGVPVLAATQNAVWWVLEPGDTLQVRVSDNTAGASQATFTFFGALLDL